MDDVVQMEELECDKNAGNEELGFSFLEATSAAHMVSEVSTNQQIHNQIKVLPVLESIGHIDDVRVFKFRQQLPLVED